MSLSLSTVLRSTSFGTLPVINGGTGVTSSTGTTSVVLSNGPTIDSPRITTVALIGPSASSNITRFPNSLSIISNTASGIQQNESHNIGLVAEGTGHATNTAVYGIGLYGVGYTNAATRSGGVVGEGHVSATSDTGSAIGVRGYSNDTHAGGMNIGLYSDAIGGSLNYALYMNSGNITNVTTQSWVLGGNLTFSGAYSVTIPTLSLGNALPIASGGTGAISASAALTALGAQSTLVSGTNIKTINGSSILGSGDITVAGSGGGGVVRMNFIGTLSTVDSDVAFVPDKNITITGITANLTQSPNTAGSFSLKKNGTVVATVTIPTNQLILGITTVSIAGTHADSFTVSLTASSGKNLTITLIYG